MTMLPEVVIYLIPTVLILIGIRKYREAKWGSCQNNVKLNGKVVVITGANSGIGFEIAKEMAKKEAEVIFACRDIKRASAAISEIKNEVGNNSILVPMELDLGSVKSIKKFVQEFKSNYSRLHILVNNAGVSFPQESKQKTHDGFEIHFGVNHLGHFLLTNLLLDTLKNSAPCRVVIVASAVHERGKILLDDLNLENVHGKSNGYANSKLANVYFGRELAKRVEQHNIHVYMLCPGFVYTNLFKNHKMRWYHYIILAPIVYLFMRTPKQGAQTAMFCATDPSIENETGYIYKDCRKFKSNLVLDDTLGQKLWEASETLLRKFDT